MRPLQRKLGRELWQLRGQVLAIAVVIAGGVATLVMSLTSLDALTQTRDAFYRDSRFADVFVSLERAPQSLRDTLADIAGVQQVETRVTVAVNLDVPGFPDPVTGEILSLPDGRNAEINRLYLRAGRLPTGEADWEVVLSEAFAEAQNLSPGDRLAAIINGRRQPLQVVGIALSPEYIYQIKPGELFPDFARHGVLWMNRTPLAAAYDRDGAFNDAVFTLTRDARAVDVIERLDLLFERYGGLGAITRDDQISHRYLEVELGQLRTMATVFPTIFLGVAAFLLNVVLNRLIRMQRDQIGILKAFGYRDGEIAMHFMQMVMVIVTVGLVLGIAAGIWLGQGMSELYRTFFRFPFLEYRLGAGVLAIGILVTSAAGLGGTLTAVRRALRLTPAEAMRPEPQAVFRATLIERLGLQRWLRQPSRMILRNLERQPLKALLTVVGLSMACAILTLGRFQDGAVDYLVQVQFGIAQRDDLTITFAGPTSAGAIFELAAIEGIEHVEPFRTAAVRLHHGHARYRTAIQGLAPDATLRRVLDTELAVVPLPPEGILLSDHLARELAAAPGDELVVEFLTGQRRSRTVPVAGVVQEFTGVSAYMALVSLNRLMGDGTAVSGAMATVTPGMREAVIARLKETPRVAAVTDRLTAVRNFYESMADIVLTFALITTLLAGSIAFGVVYNSARVALAERARELASLRVLGFTRGEIRYILLGELGLLTLLAIPLGFVIGIGLMAYIVHGIASDLYRIPLVVRPSVFAFAAGVVIAAAALSAAVVARRLGELDLVAVLKTRE